MNYIIFNFIITLEFIIYDGEEPLNAAFRIPNLSY